MANSKKLRSEDPTGSPQIEDGYTRIANDLFEAILKFPFSKREQNVVYAVIRKTYGYQRKSDVITSGQIAKMTNMDRANVLKVFKSLIKKNVLVESGNGKHCYGQYVKSIGINKHHQEWITGVKTTLGSKQHWGQNNPGTGVKTTPKLGSKRHPQKKEIKNKGGSALPEWLDKGAWNDFLDHRKALKKPLKTQKAINLNLNILEKHKDRQRELVDRTIERGWTGLIPGALDKTEKSDQVWADEIMEGLH